LKPNKSHQKAAYHSYKLFNQRTMPLQVKLLICKNDGQSDLEMPTDSRMSKSLANLDLQDADDDTQLYKMAVESSGKYTRKATWEDLTRFTGQEMTPEVLVDWIGTYQKKCFPEGTSLRRNIDHHVNIGYCVTILDVSLISLSPASLRLGKAISYTQEMLHSR
jgi:hypothetical protein